MKPVDALNRLTDIAASFFISQTFATACTLGVFAMSLHMLVVCEPGAKERSEVEYQSLLEDAGFREVQVIRLEGPRNLVVARKP